jgi:hypothetical protein
MPGYQKQIRDSAHPRDLSQRRPTRDAQREPPLVESFHLLVKCTSEAEQRDLYDRLTAEGRTCRVLSL